MSMLRSRSMPSVEDLYVDNDNETVSTDTTYSTTHDRFTVKTLANTHVNFENETKHDIEVDKEKQSQVDNHQSEHRLELA